MTKKLTFRALLVVITLIMLTSMGVTAQAAKQTVAADAKKEAAIEYYQNGEPTFFVKSFLATVNGKEWLYYQFIMTAGSKIIPANTDAQMYLLADGEIFKTCSEKINRAISANETYSLLFPLTQDEMTALKGKTSDFLLFFDGKRVAVDAEKAPRVAEAKKDNWVIHASDGFAGGTGSEDDPYLIETPQELAFLAKSVNNGNSYYSKYIQVVEEIDLAGKMWTPIGRNNRAAFKGNFDGSEMPIKNITVSDASNVPTGLFGHISYGIIKNVNLKDVFLSSNIYVGAVAGKNISAKITNCYADGFVIAGNYSGGIVGCNSSIITDSVSNCVVIACEAVGGIAGITLGDSQINNCSFLNLVSGRSRVGGIAGDVSGGSFADCYLGGSIIGYDAVTGVVAGIINEDAKFENLSFSTPTANVTFAGKIHENANAEFINCQYSLGGSSINMESSVHIKIEYPPVIIGSAKELISLAEEVNGGNTYEGRIIKLSADINLAKINWVPIGTEENPFMGDFDGDGHLIKNLTVNMPDTDYAGLFGCVYGQIRNVRLSNCNVVGRDYVGALVGYSYDNIRNSSVTGTVEGRNSVGGLVGYQWEGFIADCYAEVDVSGVNSVGGFTGASGASAYQNCYSIGSVTAEGNRAGGFIGSSSVYEIKDCYSEGSVSGTEQVGGFIGYGHQTTITGAYSSGNVAGTDNVGGFAGLGEGTKFENCYAKGSVNAFGTSGGFIGRLEKAFFPYVYAKNCYFAGGLAKTQTGGFAGFADAEANLYNCTYPSSLLNSKRAADYARSKQTSAMKSSEFVSELSSQYKGIWLADTKSINDGYPVLSWQINGFEQINEVAALSWVNSQGQEEPINKPSANADLDCELYLYYDNLFSPPILKVDGTMSLDGEILKSSSGTKNYMMCMAFFKYEDDSLVYIKTDTDTVYQNTMRYFNITVSPAALSLYGITEETLHSYYAKVFMWESGKLESVIEPVTLNSVRPVSDSLELSIDTSQTDRIGLVGFMPEDDGYYEIRTEGNNIDISGVVSTEEALYSDNSLAGYEILPVHSTAGVSTYNKLSYNLKGGHKYYLKLSNAGGSGEYTCTITKNEDVLTAAAVQHNLPVISQGMTKIYWNGGAVVRETDENWNEDRWYNYSMSENKWANVELQEGSMFVWVPRYAYRITEDNYGESDYLNQIEIKYLSGTTNTAYDGTVCKTTAQNPGANDFIVHPGFTHGGVTYSGLWVAKFQASGVKSDYAHFEPNASIMRSVSISNILTLKDKFNAVGNPYGLPTSTASADAHLMKNSEWAAVAYLAYSSAGNTPPSMNYDSSYLSGGGNYIYNVEQSTTHNEYGIYDMSGAAYETVAASVPQAYTWGLNTKYYEEIDYAGNGKGYALKETKGWNGDQANTHSSSDYIYVRGSYANNPTTTTGIKEAGLFAYRFVSEGSSSRVSWRAAIWIPGTSLDSHVAQISTQTYTYDSDTLLNNMLTGRMEGTSILGDNSWGDVPEQVNIVYSDLHWDKLQPTGSVEIVNGEIIVNSEIDVDYMEGTMSSYVEFSPRFNQWRDKGVSVAMRLFMEEPNVEGCEMPQWVIDAIEDNGDRAYTVYRETHEIPGHRKTSYHPNYANEILIAAHENVIKQLAEIYNDDSLIAIVQIGSLGRFGEWNIPGDSAVYELEPDIPITFPDVQLADRYVRPYIKYFDQKILSMRRPHELGKKYGITAMHDDAIGSNDVGSGPFLTRAYEGHIFEGEVQPGMPHFWHNKVIHGETATLDNGKWSWFSNQIPSSSVRSTHKLNNIPFIDNTIKQVTMLHQSFFKFAVKDGDIPTAQYAQITANMNDVRKNLGARLWISELGATGNFESGTQKDITITWENGGIAPFYFDWDVEISLLNTQTNQRYIQTTNPAISKCMPGEKYYQNVSLDLTDVPAGQYKLEVAVVSPYEQGTLKNDILQLANTGFVSGERFVLKTLSITN